MKKIKHSIGRLLKVLSLGVLSLLGITVILLFGIEVTKIEPSVTRSAFKR